MGMLMKNGVPYASGSEIPEGGTKGQVLAKASDISGDFEWVNGGGDGGVNATFDVATIPQGPTSAHEIIAIVSNADSEYARLSYIRQSDGTLPNAVNLGVLSGLGEDSFELPTKEYINNKALSPTGWGVVRTGVVTVTFNNSKWSSSATVDVSELGFSSGADYDVVAQPTTGGTAAPWGNAIAYVNADKGASSFSVSSVTMEESLSGTVNVKYTIFAKGYGAVAYTGEIPTGGTTGQVLTKRSDVDGDYGWVNGGGSSIVPFAGKTVTEDTFFGDEGYVGMSLNCSGSWDKTADMSQIGTGATIHSYDDQYLYGTISFSTGYTFTAQSDGALLRFVRVSLNVGAKYGSPPGWQNMLNAKFKQHYPGDGESEYTQSRTYPAGQGAIYITITPNGGAAEYLAVPSWIDASVLRRPNDNSDALIDELVLVAYVNRTFNTGDKIRILGSSDSIIKIRRDMIDFADGYGPYA